MQQMLSILRVLSGVCRSPSAAKKTFFGRSSSATYQLSPLHLALAAAKHEIGITMASSPQALANQQNAQQSTGPRTPEGKRASSLNAVRHGLTGQLVVLPGEDNAPYEAFRAKLSAELAPKTTVEEMFVQTICDTQWRLERARKAEANILALVYFEGLPGALAEIEDPAHRAAMLEAHAMVKYERPLRNLQIQEARLQRTLFKSVEELDNLQAKRRQAEEHTMSEAINLQIAHQAREIPFIPAENGFVFTSAQIDREITRRGMLSHPSSPFGASLASAA